MRKTKDEIEQQYWLQFIENAGLESHNHQEQLGQFWLWYQAKKSLYEPPKEKIIYRDRNVREGGGTKIRLGA